MSVASLISKEYDDQIRSAAMWKASQPPQGISLVVMNYIANEIEGYIFYDTDTDKCVTDLHFSRYI